MIGCTMVATTTLPAGKAGTPLTVVAPDAPPFGTRAPGSSGRAAVVVLHERQGVTDQLLARARSLAEHGFLAVVPHLFHRSGEPTGQPGDAAAGEAWQSRLNGADLAVDLGAAVDQARELDAETVGVLGFCLGGSVALWAAAPAGCRCRGHLLRRRHRDPAVARGCRPGWSAPGR